MENNKTFSKETDFFESLKNSTNKLYSVVELNSSYNITPELLINKNYESIYLDSVEVEDQIIHREGIFKNKSNMYLYLSRNNIRVESFRIKIYYEVEKINETMFFIKNLKKLK